MAPSIPDKISCATDHDLALQLRDVQTTLNLPESEDSWEKIGRSMQTLAAMCRGGAYKLDPAFVNALKANYKAITAGMITERTRLSGIALDLVTTCVQKLGARFEPLIALFLPALLKVLERPNKVFVARGQACLAAVVENCHVPTIVPYLREAVKEKSQSLRLGAAEATVLLLEHWDKGLLDVRESSGSIRRRGNVEDIEIIMKDTARDANPGVRQVGRKIYDLYAELWPERMDGFLAPLSPTLKRYLNIKATSKPALKAAPALKIKPVQQASVEVPSVLPSGPSRPHRSNKVATANAGLGQSLPSSHSGRSTPDIEPSFNQARRPPARMNRVVTAPAGLPTTNIEEAAPARHPIRPASRAGRQLDQAIAMASAQAGPSVTRPASRTELHSVASGSGRITPNATVRQASARPPVVTTKEEPTTAVNHLQRVQRARLESEPAPIVKSGKRVGDAPPVRHLTSKDPPVRPQRKAQPKPSAEDTPLMVGESRPPSRAARNEHPGPAPSRHVPDVIPVAPAVHVALPPSPPPAPSISPPLPPKSAPPLLEVFSSSYEVGDLTLRPTATLSQSMPPSSSPVIDAVLLPTLLTTPQVSTTPPRSTIPPAIADDRPMTAPSAVTSSNTDGVEEESTSGTVVEDTVVTQSSEEHAEEIPREDIRPSSSMSTASSGSSKPSAPGSLKSSQTSQHAPAPSASSEFVTPVVGPGTRLRANPAPTSSGTKRPPTLAKFAVAAPAGQVKGGFAPTRRRAGLTEPTISQLAKQKPPVSTATAGSSSKPAKRPIPAALASKRAEPPAPVVPAKRTAAPTPAPPRKEPPALRNKASSVKLATKAAAPMPSKQVASSSPPPEVLVAMQVALPPVAADEVPVSMDEAGLLPQLATSASSSSELKEEVELPSRTPQRPVEYLAPEMPRPNRRLSPNLLDMDTIAESATLPPSTAPPPGEENGSGNLMDWDMSVILPENCAPLQPQTFSVHRDRHDEPPSIQSTPITPRPAKFKVDEAMEVEVRTALSERELNVMFGP